jgi:DNA-binding cell septation regulator SpoVG
MVPQNFHGAQLPPRPKVRVMAVRNVSRGNLRALVDIALGPSLIIRDFRIVQKPGQRPWVSPPTREWQGEDGKRKYTTMIELSGSLKVRVEQAVLAAWQAEEARHVYP